MSKKKATTKAAPAKTKPGTSNPMDLELLEQMVLLMSANDLNTVDVRDGDKRVILKRGAVQQSIAYTAAPVTAPANPPASTAPTKEWLDAFSTPAAPAEDKTLVPIKSPMVGTFYSSPSPDSKPFVTVGSVVAEDTDVCTIEAMKNFVPIKAETRGTIAKILVNNGQTVHFGQPLFLVKP
jgi:acetyl-CoA carboxylase biotin carboxyl carrier protein